MNVLNKKIGLFFVSLLIGAFVVQATLIGPGDLAFTGFNADDDDDIAFVVLKDVDPSSTVYFSEEAWDGSSFGGDAFTITWTSPASVLSAGTVVTFNEIDAVINGGYGASIGSISGRMTFSASAELVLAFVGTSTTNVTSFLSGIANDSGQSLAGTGLTFGTNAILLNDSDDVGQFVGARDDQGSFSAYNAEVNDLLNWSTASGSGSQSAGFVPFNTTSFAIPEPSTLILGLLGAVGVFSRRRKVSGK